jgi:hypothetical protein
MSLLTRNELVERLNANIVDIYFTKVSTGGVRKMRATLNRTLIPGNPAPVNETSGPQSAGLLTVYDVETNDWRSFRIENVHATITPSLGEVLTDGRVQLD